MLPFFCIYILNNLLLSCWWAGTFSRGPREDNHGSYTFTRTPDKLLCTAQWPTYRNFSNTTDDFRIVCIATRLVAAQSGISLHSFNIPCLSRIIGYNASGAIPNYLTNLIYSSLTRYTLYLYYTYIYCIILVQSPINILVRYKNRIFFI